MVEGTQLLDLGAQPTLCIISFCEARDVAALCASSSQLRSVLDDHVWSRLLRQDYGVEERVSPAGEALESFRETYGVWAAALKGEDIAPFVRRAVVAWRKIKAFLAAELPDACSSINPGASEEDIRAAEEKLGVRLPPALKVLYRIHDGQWTAFDRQLASGSPTVHEEHMPMLTHGLFGGYEFYQHLTSVRMLPLARMLHYTSLLRNPNSRMGRVFGDTAARHVVWAANAYDNGHYFKYFAVDTESGSIRVSCQDGPALAAPELPGCQDAVLRWFEEYASRLEAGWYGVEPQAESLGLGVGLCKGICLFPKMAPQMVTAVTRGVQVRASATYIPEMSLQEAPQQHTFAYSIRIKLLPEDQQLAAWLESAGKARALSSCQLLARHWVVLDADMRPQPDREVRGEAVIGKYPLLRPGEPDFVYQSCTQQEERRGAMEGDFLFVEGSIKQPTGPEWEVICPRFVLEVPQFIY